MEGGANSRRVFTLQSLSPPRPQSLRASPASRSDTHGPRGPRWGITSLCRGQRPPNSSPPPPLPPPKEGNSQCQHLGKTDEPICPGANQEPDPDVPLPAAPMSPEPGKPSYGWEPACPHEEEGSPGVLGRVLYPRSCSAGERLHSLLDGSNNKTSHGGRAAEMHLWNAEQQMPPSSSCHRSLHHGHSKKKRGNPKGPPNPTAWSCTEG